MNDPLQINSRDRGRTELLDPRSGRAVPIRAYNRPEPTNEPDDLATLLQYFWILWKQKWILVLAAALGTVAGLGYVLRMTPLYIAKATVEIQKPPEPFGKPVVQQNSTETQIQLLLSSGARRHAVGKALQKNTDISNTYVVGPLANVRNLLKMKDPAKTTSWEESIGYASSFLSVTPVKDSEILAIQTFSPNPQAAAEYANTVAEEFIVAIQDQRWKSYEESNQWMTRTQLELKTKIENSQQQLAEFAKTHGLMFLSGGQTGAQSAAEEQLKRIATELSAAQADRIKQHSYTKNTASSPTEALPQVLDSGPMAGYQSELAKYRQQKAELLVNLTPANDKVMAVQAKIDELNSLIKQEQSNIRIRNSIDDSASVTRENDLKAEFEKQSKIAAAQSDDLIRYNILKSDIDTNQRLYASMLEQGKEASIASALRTTGARVVDRAGPSQAPVQPDLMFYVTLGMMGGLCCGAGFVIIRSRADLTVQAPGVMEIELNVRELGVIPSARTDRAVRKLRAFSGALPSAANGGRRTLDTADCLEMVTRSDRPSAMAEAFRATMTSILLSDENGNRPKVLVFTSASPGEGKSTIISNLAIALAQINQRVLLIDADMRLPRAHAIFDVPNNFGLSDVLHEVKPVHEYVEESLFRKTHIPYLYVLPAGPARTNLSRLFHSKRMHELLDRFRDTFDVVLIDTAPVLVVPDSRILARASDAVVLVVRAHQTHQQAAFAAASRFASDGTRVLGTILNDWDPKMSTQNYGGYYSQNGYHPEN